MISRYSTVHAPFCASMPRAWRASSGVREKIVKRLDIAEFDNFIEATSNKQQATSNKQLR
jgi:hypothetical protein